MFKNVKTEPLASCIRDGQKIIIIWDRDIQLYCKLGIESVYIDLTFTLLAIYTFFIKMHEINFSL